MTWGLRKLMTERSIFIFSCEAVTSSSGVASKRKVSLLAYLSSSRTALPRLSYCRPRELSRFFSSFWLEPLELIPIDGYFWIFKVSNSPDWSVSSKRFMSGLYCCYLDSLMSLVFSAMDFLLSMGATLSSATFIYISLLTIIFYWAGFKGFDGWSGSWVARLLTDEAS